MDVLVVASQKKKKQQLELHSMSCGVSYFISGDTLTGLSRSPKVFFSRFHSVTWNAFLKGCFWNFPGERKKNKKQLEWQNFRINVQAGLSEENSNLIWMDWLKSYMQIPCANIEKQVGGGISQPTNGKWLRWWLTSPNCIITRLGLFE